MFQIKNINLGCHQIPERCFCFKGKVMPFCSRCFGSSVGHIISMFLFLFGRLPSFRIAIFFIVPLIIDWSFQNFFEIMSNNYRRFITGVLGGLGVGIIIWKIIDLLIVKFVTM